MKKIFLDYGINLTDNQVQLFEDYYRLLIEYNNKFNLTAITEKDQVIYKNFLDSAIFKDYVVGKTHLDIGSGGGFPAIPLKIVKPELNLTLLEATGKKCEFLTALKQGLNLDNVTVLNGRAEDFANKPEYRESFDVVTARAVARLNILTEYCLPFVKIGGTFVAYKAQAEEEIQEALNSIKILGGKIKDIVTIQIQDFTRTAVIIEKVKPTNPKFPRSNAQIRKKPL